VKQAAAATDEKHPINIVQFANSTLLDENGLEVKLGSLWRERTILFVFLRHFGCVSCRSHAVEVWSQREKYEKGGARIVFVGNGSPHFIGVFKADLQLDGAPVYTDPSLTSFRAAGFKRGFLLALGPQALANGLHMLAKGYRQGPMDKATGDLWQLGGLVVIKPGGRIAYHYISLVMGDYAPEKDLKNFE
jgi:hypothetical protein